MEYCAGMEADKKITIPLELFRSHAVKHDAELNNIAMKVIRKRPTLWEQDQLLKTLQLEHNPVLGACKPPAR